MKPNENKSPLRLYFLVWTSVQSQNKPIPTFRLLSESSMSRPPFLKSFPIKGESETIKETTIQFYASL